MVWLVGAGRAVGEICISAGIVTSRGRLDALVRRYGFALGAAFLVAAGTLAVFLHQRAYGPFFTDDGFISLRYTQRLLEGKGLTWTDNERVEGYSNLLWVLLCALPGLFGANLVAGARAMGMLCTAATLGAVLAAVRPSRAAQWLGAGLAMGLLAASDSIAVWSMGGLEAPLVGALLSWGIVLALASARDGGKASTLGAGVCFGLVCLARVDAALWPAAGVLGIALGFRRRGFHTCIAIAAGALACIAAQLLFRLAYYHDYLPNTAYAKVALNDARLATGIEHVEASLLPLGASWLALASCGVHGLRHARLRPLAIVHLVLAGAWTAYMIRIGGDIFPAWRLLTYVVVIAALFVAFVLGDDLRAPVEPAALRWIAALVALAALGSYADPVNWAKQETWQWDGRVVGRTLARMFGDERPLVAVDAAGTIPFYSKFPALDMLGLTDRYLAHHRPHDMGAGLMGHELGDPAYYLKRAPDIVCFGVPPCQRAGKFPAQKQLVSRKDFQREYEFVRLQARDGEQTLTASLWVRRDGKIGIRAASGSVFVPSYFLTQPEGALAALTAADSIQVDLPSGSRAGVDHIDLDAGHWRVQALAPAGTARLAVSSKSHVLVSGDARSALEFDLAARMPVDLELSVAFGASFATAGITFHASARP